MAEVRVFQPGGFRYLAAVFQYSSGVAAVNDRQGLTHVPCPLCGSSRHRPWTTEREFTVVRCEECRLLLVNPRPAPRAIDEAVRTGVHGEAAAGLDVTARRVPAKVRYYAARLRSLRAGLLLHRCRRRTCRVHHPDRGIHRRRIRPRRGS